MDGEGKRLILEITLVVPYLRNIFVVEEFKA